jgi:hypothetical protein
MRFVKILVLTGAAAAALAMSAQANGKRGNDCCAPACCAPANCCEMVPEYYTTTRTVMRQECRQEKYTAYRCESYCVPEQRTCTTYKRVCETTMVPKTVCCKVPCWEDRVEMCTRMVKQCVTEYRTKCVDNGHWETQCVPAGPGLFDRLCGKNDCCDSCPRYKSKKVWVSCKQTVCEPVTRTKCVRECYPVCKKVCTYKTEVKTVMTPCTTWKCVPECSTVTVNVTKTRMVPYEACRMVSVCVPHCETVTLCRMVPRQPCAPAAPAAPAAPVVETK